MIFDPKDLNRVRAFSMTILGLTITQQLWEKQSFALTFTLWQTTMIGIWLSVYLLMIYGDRNEYVQSQKIKSFTPTFLGLGIIMLNIGFYLYWYNT
jgi:hypothetical protein